MGLESDIGLLTTDQKIVSRCQEIAKSFSYSFVHLERTHDFNAEPVEFRLVVIGGADFPNGGEFCLLLKVIRRHLPNSFILYVDTKNSVENSSYISKEYGADHALSELEFFESSKPDYIFSQVIRATFLPIKSGDILPDRKINFDIYHLLPQREKFLKFCFAGDEIDPKKIEKLKSVDEFYIHRNQAEQYAEYLTSRTDNSELGLNLRCRGRFLALYAGYMGLVLAMTDQSTQGSFERGTNLFNHCKILAVSLLSVLSSHPNPWRIIHNATIGDFGSLERAPAVAAYAGILGQKLGLANVEELMIAALVSELGILYLSREITGHLRNDTVDKMTEEDVKEFQKYPMKSISVTLEQRFQLSETFRNIVLGVHERADKQGFPKKRMGRHIPIESFVVHFAYELDRRIAVRMGKARADLDTTLYNFVEEELKDPTHFTLQFIHKLKIALKSKLEKN